MRQLRCFQCRLGCVGCPVHLQRMTVSAKVSTHHMLLLGTCPCPALSTGKEALLQDCGVTPRIRNTTSKVRNSAAQTLQLLVLIYTDLASMRQLLHPAGTFYAKHRFLQQLHTSNRCHCATKLFRRASITPSYSSPNPPAAPAAAGLVSALTALTGSAAASFAAAGAATVFSRNLSAQHNKRSILKQSDWMP